MSNQIEYDSDDKVITIKTDNKRLYYLINWILGKQKSKQNKPIINKIINDEHEVIGYFVAANDVCNDEIINHYKDHVELLSERGEKPRIGFYTVGEM